MISIPGIYTIPIETYHHDANLCAGPSISASGLKTVLDCPAIYWATSPYNPKRYPPKDTKPFAIGRAAHSLVLGEPEFHAHFVISPYAEFRTNEAKDWRDSQAKTILKAPEFDTVLAMAEAQRSNPHVMHAFEFGKPEMSIIWKDEETGIWLRSRPDYLPDDPAQRFIVDYKSCVSIEPRKLSADAWDYGYHLQAALQFDAVQTVMGVNPLGVAHVVQEKTPPYLADIRMFQEEQLEYGRKLYRKALRRFADCMASGKWPGYTEAPQYFETPYYITKQMEEFNGNETDAGAATDGGSDPID